MHHEPNLKSLVKIQAVVFAFPLGFTGLRDSMMSTFELGQVGIFSDVASRRERKNAAKNPVKTGFSTGFHDKGIFSGIFVRKNGDLMKFRRT